MIIENISAGYNNKAVINNISFTIDRGKVYALLGLNGSGKTTIIKMICGLLKPKTGNIFSDNINILELKERDRAKLISYVPQNSNIIYNTSVLDVVLMGITPYLNLFEVPNKNHIRQAYECLKKLGIEELANLNYLYLSGGQKQIVIIARALLQNGSYMVLDEPDSSLDLKNKNMLMKKICEIINYYGTGCLISMHNPEYALNFCDKIFLLKNKGLTEIDVRVEKIESIEKKLSEIYGNIKLLKHKNKYVVFYDE